MVGERRERKGQEMGTWVFATMNVDFSGHLGHSRGNGVCETLRRQDSDTPGQHYRDTCFENGERVFQFETQRDRKSCSWLIYVEVQVPWFFLIGSLYSFDLYLIIQQSDTSVAFALYACLPTSGNPGEALLICYRAEVLV